jgi:hypothetical protein
MLRLDGIEEALLAKIWVILIGRENLWKHAKVRHSWNGAMIAQPMEGIDEEPRLRRLF